MDEKIIQTYIERISNLEEKPRGLTEEELQEIALEIGITPEELAKAQELSRLHAQRGERFLAHGHPEDAARAFEEALILRPGNESLRLQLGQCYLARYNTTIVGDKADLERAEALFRGLIENNPRLDAAYLGLSAVQKARKEEGSSGGLLYAAAGGLVVTLACIAATAFFLVGANLTPEEKVSGDSMHSESLSDSKGQDLDRE